MRLFKVGGSMTKKKCSKIRINRPRKNARIIYGDGEGNYVSACSKCPLPAKPNQRYCKECHAEYMREWRLKEKERILNLFRETLK